MITDPAAATVLCFGDSNTHGYPAQDPGEPVLDRLPADVRWTGRLQRLLGPRWHVIEEGLNGRTTDLDYDDRPGCHGRAYLGPCLRSHHPLDVVVLMLGTNDTKTQFGRTAADIAAAVDGLVTEIETWAVPAPVTVLVSPIHIDDTRPGFDELNSDAYGPGSVRASTELAAALRQVADARGTLFADAATVAQPGHDGVHLSTAAHAHLAVLLSGVIRGALA